MFNQNITLYSKYKDQGSEKWTRRIVNGAYYEVKKGELMRAVGTNVTDGLRVIIPLKSNRDLVVKPGHSIVLGASYVEVEKSVRELAESYLVTSVDKKDFDSELSHLEVMAK